MNEVSGIVLSSLGVFLTTAVGFFVNTVLDDFRSNPTVVYSVDSQNGETSIWLSNVSRVPVSDARLSITCQERPCLKRSGDHGSFLSIVGSGNVPADVFLDNPNNSLAQAGFTLSPGAEVYFKVYPSIKSQPSLLVLFKSHISRDRSVQFVKARSLLGFTIQYHIPVLSILFFTVLIVFLITLGWLAWTNFWSGRPAPRQTEKEAPIEPLHLVVSFAPRDSRGDGGDG